MSGPRIFAPEYYARMRALEAGSWWNAGMRDVAARLLDVAALPPTGLMVDLGCGSGQTMAWFRARRPGWRAIGFDVAREGLRAAHDGRAGAVFAGSALSIPLGEGSVDLVLALDVLQHLPLDRGDAAALGEIRRILRRGGGLLLRTNAQAIPRAADDAEYNFHKYTTAELRAKLVRAGFSVERLGRLNAVLGLAEIPRELRARRAATGGYHGLLAQVPRAGVWWRAKRAWLGLEGRMVAAGWSLPLGRTLLALARADSGSDRG
jgi:SAM-dependent methyltransferase